MCKNLECRTNSSYECFLKLVFSNSNNVLLKICMNIHRCKNMPKSQQNGREGLGVCFCKITN